MSPFNVLVKISERLSVRGVAIGWAILKAKGFAVYEADNAADAIRILELDDEIRLIFTDINMPGSMDGVALAHYVRGRWPPVKIIITSGYVKMRGNDLPVGALFIEKPYDLKHLAHKMTELMAAYLNRSRKHSRLNGAAFET
jgi:DNA-binding NtrC family response regulator